MYLEIHKKKFEFVPGSLKPSATWGNCQYLLYVKWDDETPEENQPSYFMGIWEDQQWWIRDDRYEDCDDFYGCDDPEEKTPLRPINFTPLPPWYELIGWCPLFGTGV